IDSPAIKEGQSPVESGRVRKRSGKIVEREKRLVREQRLGIGYAEIDYAGRAAHPLEARRKVQCGTGTVEVRIASADRDACILEVQRIGARIDDAVGISAAAQYCREGSCIRVDRDDLRVDQPVVALCADPENHGAAHSRCPAGGNGWQANDDAIGIVTDKHSYGVLQLLRQTGLRRAASGWRNAGVIGTRKHVEGAGTAAVLLENAHAQDAVGTQIQRRVKGGTNPRATG